MYVRMYSVCEIVGKGSVRKAEISAADTPYIYLLRMMCIIVCMYNLNEYLASLLPMGVYCEDTFPTMQFSTSMLINIVLLFVCG